MHKYSVYAKYTLIIIIIIIIIKPDGTYANHYVVKGYYDVSASISSDSALTRMILKRSECIWLSDEVCSAIGGVTP
jgi:hypothetical protein